MLKRKDKPKREAATSGRKGFRQRLPERFRNRPLKQLTLATVAPNIATLLALCTGMTAIRMAMLERWDFAIVAVLFAGILDGMDGRLARLLGSSSRFGAELDSFSDLISFGVVPALVIYLRTLHQWNESGWGIVLFFTVCITLRLARFNTRSIEGNAPLWSQGFFTGVPSPAAAYLVLIPLMLQQYFPSPFLMNPLFYACVMVMVGFLMVSRIPTFSLKKVKLPQKAVLPLMLLIFLTAAAIYIEPWLTLSIIGIVYVGLIPFSIRSYRRLKNQVEAQVAE